MKQQGEAVGWCSFELGNDTSAFGANSDLLMACKGSQRANNEEMVFHTYQWWFNAKCGRLVECRLDADMLYI